MSSKGKVVKIEFFTLSNLPARLMELARKQGAKLGNGIIAVKTLVSSPPSYEFEAVGTKPDEIQQFMEQLAHQDGVDLGVAVQKALQTE